MNSNQTNTQLLLSVIMTIIFPLMGIVSLYYAITANNQFKRNDERYVVTLNKAYKWTLVAGFTTIVASVGFFIFFICLYASK